jgi:class 3 adenylate cyclase/tetratricopeptide (TPR) repeat protein
MITDDSPGLGGSGSERRQVTVMFSDASGYTELAEDLDPEVVRELMWAVYDEAAAIVERYGGRVDKLMGDAVLAVFGDPVAHEDDADCAVRAALDLHDAVDAMGSRFESAAGRAVEVHSGINTGVIVTGDTFDDRSGPLGDMVNVAARLQTLADAGEILIGSATRGLLRDDRLAVTDVGERRLTGRREPVRVFRVERRGGASLVPSRRVSRFIGRQEELGVLASAVERLRDGDRGLVTVCAEAGAGKSRLFEEFRSRLDTDVVWLEGRAYPSTASVPYAPVIDLIARSAGVDERDPVDAVAAKLDAMVAALVPGHPQAAAVLRQLFDIVGDDDRIDLEAFRTRLFDVVRDLVDAVARRGPTVLCLQDLHWADPSTVDLIRRLAAAGHEPVLTVCNFRPGFELAAESERAIDLSLLSPRQTRELLGALLDGAEIPDELLDSVVERVQGNPFFVEEIVNRLLETDMLVRDGDRWALVRPIDEIGVPGTIRGVIAARIDALDADDRRMLREVSVVGREFPHRLVRDVASRPDRLDDGLGRLLSIDLIREKSLEPEVEYVFKHALTQEVAYEGLVVRERRQLHERVARAIESGMPERLGELAETLAFHWERSGHVIEAVHHLKRSGRKALERYALAEADDHYSRALSLLTGDSPWIAQPVPVGARDRLVVEVILEWAQVHYYHGNFGALDELMNAHADAADRLDHDGLRSRWLAWRGHVAHLGRGEVAEAITLFDEAIALGERSGDPAGEAYAHAWIIWALGGNGRTSETTSHWRRVQELLPSIEDAHDRRYIEIKAMGGAAIAANVLGDFQTGRELAARLRAIGVERGNRRATALSLFASAFALYACGDFDTVRGLGDQMHRVDPDPLYRVSLSTFSAGLAAISGDVDSARHVLEESHSACRALGLKLLVATFESFAALTLLWEGRVGRAMRELGRCRADAVRRGDVFAAATTLDVSFAVVHARIATGAAAGSVWTALTNPGFVLRHVVGAARRARRELEQLLVTLDEVDLPAYRFQVHWELAVLADHEGRHDDAVHHARQIIDALGEFTDTGYVHQARELLGGR